jgi:hypothetical protein
MSSSSINIAGMPTLPIIGYYDTESTSSDKNEVNYTYNSYNTLETNLKQNCTNNGSTLDNNEGIYNPKNYTNNIPPNTTSLNVPFFLAKTGLLTNTLTSAVQESCANSQSKLVNQIQYLTCQLEESRNQVYKSSDFNLMTGNSIKSIFEKFANLKIFFIVIFIITMYLLISGFIGSLDVAINVFNIVAKRKVTAITYWIGLFLGLTIPMIILIVVFNNIVCKSIAVMESYNITNNSYGEKDQKRINEINSSKSLDIFILAIFIILIYGFVLVLFTLDKASLGAIPFACITGVILIIITMFIYFLYAFVPFFNSTDQKYMLNKPPLMLFIDNQESVSKIDTNQEENKIVRKTFLTTAIFIIIASIIFFFKKIFGINFMQWNILNGIFGSFAILSLPILWIINFVVGIQYFYIYPIIIIGVRFIRYFIMSILYIMYDNKNTNFSSDLLNQFDNFKDYSAPWGLIGVDELKLILNMLGYENLLSKDILDDANSNISLNKYVSTGFLGFMVEKILNKDNNMKGIILSIVIIILTIAISMIILYGIVKI